MVQVFHRPEAAVQAEQFLRRRGVRVEGGDEADGFGVVPLALPGVVGILLQRLAGGRSG